MATCDEPGRSLSKTVLVGWVFLDRHREDGITICWRRDDLVAYER